jgi:hypothetical protein
VRVHEERISVLRWQLDHLVPGETRHERRPAEASAKKPGSNLRHKPREAGPDPNPKVRTDEWITGRREALEREILIHERLIELGRDPRVLEALGELAQNRAYAEEVARDPVAAARKRGIELPGNLMLRLTVEPDRIQLQITFYDDLFPFMVLWNSDSGFSAPPDPASSSPKASQVSSV